MRRSIGAWPMVRGECKQGLLVVSGGANATCDGRAAAVRGRDIPTARGAAAEDGMACVQTRA